jgi:hypothetical protein
MLSHHVYSPKHIKIYWAGIFINDSKIIGFDSKMERDLKKPLKLQNTKIYK